MDGDDDSQSLSRRRFLGCAAGLAVGTRVWSREGVRARSQNPEFSVMTRNLYLGVDLSGLQDVESSEELRRVAGDLLATAQDHPYDARVDAMADEIVSQSPDVVALQEAVRVRTRPTDASDDEEWSTLVDLRGSLLDSLDAADETYRIAASTVTTEADLEADSDDGLVELAIADRDVVLVREGVETGETRTDTYEIGFTYSLPDTDREISLQRGYCLVDVTVGGRTVTVVNTHLESVSAIIRRLQTEELLAALPSDGPVVLAGDFNSGPGGQTGTYDRLTGRFDDTWSALRDGDGPTCCQPSTLTNENSRLNRRIDAVLYDGPLRAAAVDRVGGSSDDRVETGQGEDATTVWPSNHAGVLARFRGEWAAPTPTASPTPTPSATPTPTASPTPDETTSRRPTTAGNAGTPTPTGEDRGPNAGSGTDGSPGPPIPGDGTDGSGGSGPGFGVATALVALALGAIGRRRLD